MIAALKAELLKLLTTRSTYVIIALALLVDMFFAGFVKGYKLADPLLTSPTTFQESITIIVSLTAIFGAIASILLMSHEYRYNTILYSLTSNKSRTTFLVAKIIVLTVFTLVLTSLIAVVVPLFIQIGVGLAGNALPAQTIAYGDIIWRSLFFAWGYAMIALMIAVLVRNQIGTMMVFFILPSTIEGLLTIWLKDNASYLPFTSLGAVIQANPVLSYAHAAMVFSIYLIVGWLIAWVLFIRRDAN